MLVYHFFSLLQCVGLSQNWLELQINHIHINKAVFHGQRYYRNVSALHIHICLESGEA